MAAGKTGDELAVIGKDTRFSSDYQPENPGRPSGKLTAMLREELESDGYSVIEGEVVDENGRVTGQLARVRVKMTTYQAVAKRLLSNAAKGREKSIEMVFDRIEGKVPQRNELTGADGSDLNFSLNLENLSTEELRSFLLLLEKTKQP